MRQPKTVHESQPVPLTRLEWLMVHVMVRAHSTSELLRAERAALRAGDPVKVEQIRWAIAERVIEGREACDTPNCTRTNVR